MDGRVRLDQIKEQLLLNVFFSESEKLTCNGFFGWFVKSLLFFTFIVLQVYTTINALIGVISIKIMN